MRGPGEMLRPVPNRQTFPDVAMFTYVRLEVKPWFVKGKKAFAVMRQGWLMKGCLAWVQKILAPSGRRVADRDRRVACATHCFPFMSQPWLCGMHLSFVEAFLWLKGVLAQLAQLDQVDQVD